MSNRNRPKNWKKDYSTWAKERQDQFTLPHDPEVIAWRAEPNYEWIFDLRNS